MVIRTLQNIFNLGMKELRSLSRDKAMLGLIIFAFTVSIYSSATVTPGSLHNAPIAIADQDKSQLSTRIVNSFYAPFFQMPADIVPEQIDGLLDRGTYTLHLIFRLIFNVMYWLVASQKFKLILMQPA